MFISYMINTLSDSYKKIPWRLNMGIIIGRYNE